MTDEELVHVPVPNTPYDVHVGAGVRYSVCTELDASGEAGAVDRVAIVADCRVFELHDELELAGPMLVLDGGEGIKTLDVLGQVLDFCAESKLSRRSLLIAYGGGTIGDLTGLAASLFKRGLGVVQVPSTLLAQVDASVGGKTAINLAAGKNLAGTFHQPRAVYCDTELLGTLDEAEFQSGLGEVIKTALIEGPEELQRLENRAEALKVREASALQATVASCVRTKARIVVSDPEERGARRTLNLGHTFGHAIEHAAGYGKVPHGVAVAVGLQLAAAASQRVYPEADVDPERIGRLLAAFGLPQGLAELRERYQLHRELSADALLDGLGHDKKGSVGRPEFVLLKGPGQIELGVALDPATLRDLFA